jgi:hypothetical protein
VMHDMNIEEFQNKSRVHISNYFYDWSLRLLWTLRTTCRAFLLDSKSHNRTTQSSKKPKTAYCLLKF